MYEKYNEQDLKDLDKFISKDLEERDNIRHLDIFDVDSFPDIRRYRRGLYCHPLDLQNYLPGFPVSVLSYMAPTVAIAPSVEEVECQTPGSSNDFFDTFRTDTVTTASSDTAVTKTEEAAKEKTVQEEQLTSDTPKVTQPLL